MAYPNKLPCPDCKEAVALTVYRYEHGWCHLECDECCYTGPGEGSVTQAIKSHNEKVAAKAA